MVPDGKDIQPKRGALFEGVVLTAAAVAFGFVTLADILSHTLQPDSQLAAVVRKVVHPSEDETKGLASNPAAGNSHGGIDYTSTGSIVSLRQAQHLNPCEKTN